MALWGTLIQRIGGSVASDSNAFIDDFFKKTTEDERWGLEQTEKDVHEFIQKQLIDSNQKRGIALVTSGSTIVPLDRANNTFVDESPQVQEYQGPACAEYLLHLGYAVIFVHREDSLQPFSRHFQKYIGNGAFMEMLHMRGDQVVMDGLDQTQKSRFENIVTVYNESKHRLLNIPFTSVQQYLHLLRLTTKAINVVKSRAIAILAASVMDFHVPLPDIDAPRKKDSNFSVSFVRVPNLIRKIRKEWCPKAFLVTFKHHLKDSEMIEAAHADLEKWGVNVVACTNRHDHPNQISLVTEQEDSIVSCAEDEDINDAFASTITEMHRNFRRTREILEKAKALLLLTAKFSMLKERDLVNVDAEGNKNVKFGLGVKICADRRVADGQPPVYELKHIFQNKSHCARAHIWESKIEHKAGNTTTDVVVAFSPAGNPETIKTVWGDFWSGWAEKELVDVRDQLMNVKLTSALDVVAASISGDYTPASNLIQYMWGKIGHAWSDGEQTRIRQSLQNMIACGLNRGLAEVTDLTPLDKLMNRPRVRRFDSLILDQPASPLHSHGRRRRRGSDEDFDNPVRLSKARRVRIHQTIKSYMDDMIGDGILDAVMEYVERGAAVHVTGYSMGGMLGQLLMLYLGDRARMKGCDSSKISFVGFGSPRVGDIGFASRLRVLFDPEQLLIVMHPSDTVHAFPSTAEGYADAAIKIFLREQGAGVARRTASSFSLLPVTKSLDRIFENAVKTYTVESGQKCELCSSAAHATEQHRCRFCTERGSHRGTECPNRNKPCLLCGHENHCTGEHRCRVCQQYGHRGRECHAQRDVGLTEIVTYFRFHHFVYYNANLKTSVEFTTG
ncbi:hypothetical protein Poli38472_002295 [Pythium oligandrum]|uniref:Fungal lipase-type domain-containing protein n=1 Tax=Pythium oligandrum TaxID=41045 RepID=A0A8K1CGY2_PYTOL|nr:hypothetical protein Poli38472_002295 [Pythium oligandrum]|eukprot:TMW63354.1 hypothetical protein Poli38472_002295 [Pythium oligandrum]